MKTRRIASSIAIAAAITLGATGCGLIAPQNTTHSYAPSDGVDATIEGVHLRNILLVEDSSGDNFNVVFAGVNNSDSPVGVRMTFVSESGTDQAQADFTIEPGRSLFGHPDGDTEPTLVSVSGLRAGDAVETFIEIVSGGEAELWVPVLDGTLVEYQDFVL